MSKRPQLPPSQQMMQDVPAIQETEAERAKNLLREDANARVAAFLNGVKSLSDQYRCDLVAQVTFQGQQMKSDVIAVAR